MNSKSLNYFKHRLLQFKNVIGLLVTWIFKIDTSYGYPRTIQLEPTNNCNAKCPLCPTGAGQLKRRRGYMDVKLFKKIIDDVAGKTQYMTLWNYGEPFLHPKIFEMIDYAKKNNLFITASTNGYVFYTDDLISKLANSHLDKLIVSLDGISEDTYKLYRKGVDFKKVIDGLTKLKLIKKKKNKKDPVIEIQFIIMKHNQHELSKYEEFAQKLGDKVVYKTVNTHMVTGINELDWLPNTQFRSDYKQNHTTNNPGNSNCPVIWKSIVINYDGIVNPCCWDYQSEVVLGDLKNQTLHDVWTGTRMKNFRQTILQNKAHHICRNCRINSKIYFFSDQQTSN